MSVEKPRSLGVLGLLPWWGNARADQRSASDPMEPTQLRRSTRAKPHIKLHEPNNIISGMMVCLWDNISGPRTEQVWQCCEEEFSQEELKYFCRNTLGGEVGVKTDDESLECDLQPPTNVKFHVLPQYGTLLTSVVFSGKFYDPTTQTSNCKTKWALCSFVKRSLLERYLLIHEIISDGLLRLSCILQHLLEDKPPEESINVLTTQVEVFIRNLTALSKSSLLPLQFSSTLFTHKSPIPMDFIGRAITSHLQTFGSTVVIGESADTVNMMIDTLGLFLSPEERSLSSLAVENRNYTPYLFLQGLVGEMDKLKMDLVQSLYPTTIVDLNQLAVFQSAHSILAHRHERIKFKEEEIKSLKKVKVEPGESFAKEEVSLHMVKDLSVFVAGLLSDVQKLPTSLREGMILQARRLLIRKAVLLIKYVDSVSPSGKCESLNHTLIKRMKLDLGAPSNADWLITLAVAEKLAPGITNRINEDIQKIEDRFNELYWVL